MSKVYKIKEIRGDAKWAYRKEQLKQELRKARVLVYNNKELVIGLASVLIPTIATIVKVWGMKALVLSNACPGNDPRAPGPMQIESATIAGNVQYFTS